MVRPDDPAQRRRCKDCDQDPAQNIHDHLKPGVHRLGNCTSKRTSEKMTTHDETTSPNLNRKMPRSYISFYEKLGERGRMRESNTFRRAAFAIAIAHGWTSLEPRAELNRRQGAMGRLGSRRVCTVTS